MPEEEVKDPQGEEKVDPPPTEETPTAAVEKTEETPKPSEEKKEEKKDEQPPWHKDARFQKFISEKKELEDKAGAMRDIEKNPRFKRFLQIEAEREAYDEKEKKVDYSNMSAEEYAEKVKEDAVDAARKEHAALQASTAMGDKLAREAKDFAKSIGITDEELEKEYGPKTLEHYMKVPENLREEYIKNNPPKEVLKNLYFDKAGEAGVRKYKESIESGKRANFEAGGAEATSAKAGDMRSAFEGNWTRLFGNKETLPDSALNR